MSTYFSNRHRNDSSRPSTPGTASPKEFGPGIKRSEFAWSVDDWRSDLRQELDRFAQTWLRDECTRLKDAIISSFSDSYQTALTRMPTTDMNTELSEPFAKTVSKPTLKSASTANFRGDTQAVGATGSDGSAAAADVPVRPRLRRRHSWTKRMARPPPLLHNRSRTACLPDPADVGSRSRTALLPDFGDVGGWSAPIADEETDADDREQLPSRSNSGLFTRGRGVSSRGVVLRCVRAPESITDDCEPEGYDIISEFISMELPGRSAPGRWQDAVIELVESHWYERVVGMFVFLNAAMLGIETEFRAWGGEAGWCSYLELESVFFCVFFAAELFVRMFAHRGKFFFMENWQWNIFDSTVVCLQILDPILHSITWHGMGIPDSSSFRSFLRLVRLVRITRVLRVLTMVDDLRTLVKSIYCSLQTLGWALLLMLLIIYTFSIVLFQAAIDDAEFYTSDSLQLWYSSLPRTALTLFECITSGVSWNDPYMSLQAEHPFLIAVAYCFYVSFCVFAMMNVVTGVFVDKAMRAAKEEEDTNLAHRIRALFLDEDGSLKSSESEITWDVFQQRLATDEMRDYFTALNIDNSEARGLFNLLDIDGSGKISAEEIVNGCLRLRGFAKAVDLSLLVHEILVMHDHLVEHTAEMEHRLDWMFENVV